ncbi:MAG TPA: TetR/AcrR family transcriptional regulator [Bacteroidota bacterium]|nr:TetR/AcrR family transcriptional regulator [Bacteroidota bacterium]
MGIQERKDREKEQRREEIITAAQKVFFEKGLPAATMDEIAEAAELSKGTLYLYYKSKEDLYLAVMMRGSEIMYQMFLEASTTSENTIQALVNLGEAYYQFFRQHTNYFRMYLFFENPQFHRQVSEEMLNTCSGNDMKIWNLVIDLIKKGKKEGLLESDLDPLEASIILWSSGNALMRQMDREDNYWHQKMGVNLEAALRKSYQFLLEGMMTEEGKKKGLLTPPHSRPAHA